jgi:hypothetical protein
MIVYMVAMVTRSGKALNFYGFLIEIRLHALKILRFLWISDRDTLACIETIFRFLWISDQDTLVRPRNLVISIDFLSRYGCTQDKP